MDIKAIYRKYKTFLQPVLWLSNRALGLRLRRGGKSNQILGLQSCRMKGCHIRISGENNVIEIGDMSTLNGVSISIFGSENRIVLGPRVFLNGCSFCIEDNGNRIQLGEHTYIYDRTELSAIEGTSIAIGRDCLLSADIMVRTGDSHAILTTAGERINPSGSICIGDHVWVARDVKILKNAAIGPDCVVGAGAMVTGSTPQCSGTVLIGAPAKPGRSGITWNIDRDQK